MRQAAREKLRREWREDLPAILDGLDVRPYPQGWALDDTLEEEHEEIRPIVLRSMREIATVVCHTTGRTFSEYAGSKRKAELSKRRHMLIYLIDRLCPHKSFGEIGRFLDRHHTTVIHALRNFPKTLEADADLVHEYNLCCRHFGIKP